MSELKETLEELLSEPAGSHEEQEALEEAARLLVELVKAEGKARRFLESHRHVPPARDTGALLLAGLPLHQAARLVLREAGWPMHARDLAVRIKAGGWRHPRSRNARPDQLVFQLAARLPKYPSIFRRVAPNTFALTEWGDTPPRRDRPRPLVGVFASGGGLPARDADQELDRYFEDERNRWR